MTYNAKALARQSHGAASAAGRTNVSHVWLYRTPDARSVVETAAYFDAAYQRLNKGDVVIAIMAVGGTPVIETYVTTASSSSGVTVARESAAGLTDNTGGTTGSTLALAAVKQKIHIPIQLAGVADAQVYKSIVPFAHVLEGATFRTGKPVTTAAKATTLTATVGGVAVTGGVIALTSANQNAAGNAVNATAISGAGATGEAGGTLEFTASATTAFVEGDGYIEATVVNKDLANALASLNAG